MKYVITTHNKADYIQKVIESLINSGNQGDVLVVQDNCTDGTDKIIIDLQEKYNFLYTIKTPDVYELRSINFGLDYFGDDDDIMSIQDDVFINEDIASKYYYYFGSNCCVGLVSPRMGVELINASFYSRLKSILRSNYTLSKFISIKKIYIRQEEISTFESAIVITDPFTEVFTSVGSPLIFSKNFLKHCGLLNDLLFPFAWFDIEASIRARSMGYRNYIMPCKFESPIELGTSRQKWVKNTQILKKAILVDLYNRIYISRKYSADIERWNTLSNKFII